MMSTESKARITKAHTKPILALRKKVWNIRPRDNGYAITRINSLLALDAALVWLAKRLDNSQLVMPVELDKKLEELRREHQLFPEWWDESARNYLIAVMEALS